MASSDDESDYVVETVSNYEFLDETDDPVSFSLLPIQWEENEIIGSETQLQVFLKGNADNGLQTVLKQVIRWKFDLGKGSPEISVLTKDKTWIKLVKPRKAFSEKIIRSILITIHCLHYVRRDANVSEKLVWDYLSRVFNSFDVRPSCNDLVDHIPLIAETVKRDDSLKKCKFLLAFLEEKPRKRVEESSQAAKLSEFIIDDEDDYFSGEEGENGDDDASNDDDDLFDPVCVFCDNGGELLCCEGECLRSFHATEEAGIESSCESLNMTDRQVEQMSIFVCDNCKHKQHQCFACGELGSSDKSSGAEVFRCINATCGHFYHPYCVAILLRSDDKVAAKELREKIAAGEKFACPIHKCKVCKQPENTKEVDFQLAICRRCPTSYHRKCLPREIGFEDIEEENIITRAWEGLLPNRVLIYCLKHEIIDDIGTPVRDHVKFPFKREKIATEEKTKKRKVEIFGSNERDLAKKKRLSSENSFSRRTIEQAPRDMSSTVKKIERKAGISRYVEKLSSAPDLARKCKAGLQSIRSTRDNAISSSMEIDEASNVVANKPSLGERLYTLMSMQFENEDTSFSKLNEPLNMKTTSRKFSSEMGQLDSVAEKRLLGLVQEASSSITMRNVMSKHKILSEHGSSFKGFHDKTFTLGKVEGTVEAVRTALQKLKDGCSVDDAKTFCGPEVLNKIFKWKRGLRVYLAPFLHGMRYTSFGRHFTKEEKLKEIVDMLHWYVEDGDMLVDFCCGANDFSCLLKKKLDETGKTCLFKNYDIVQPKNDFNFEQRNWMTVRPEELQKGGSQLIMGLNPPFGVKASLANKFIDKALEFKPKLLILIVPPETERLDKKNPPYDPVWEDYKFLSGKSFYLPGSVDVNDQQMDQWNATPPVLYLWSRRDWCAKHKATAEKHGHIPILGRSNLGNDSYGVEHNSCHANIEISTSDRPKQIKQQENFSSGKVMADGHQEGSAANDSHVEKLGSHGTERGQSGESRKHGSEKLRLDVDGKSPKNGQRGGNLVTSTNNGMAEGHPSKSSELPLHQEVLQDGCQDLEPGRSRSSDSRRHDEESFGKYVDKISPKAKQNDENFVSNRNKEVRRHSSPIVVNDRIIQENHSSGSVEMALDQEIIQESYQCLEHDMLSTSHAQNRAPYATNRASGHENDGIYKVNEPFSHRLPNVGNMDGLRSQHGATYDTNHAGSRENNVMYNVNSEPLANRSFNVGNMQSRYPGQSRDGLGSNGYGASSVTGFGRDMDLHSKVQPYGYHPGFNIQRNVVDHHHDPGFGRIRSLPSISYGYASPPVESSPYITNMSATQRYAPRLDELNHNRGHEHDPGPLIYSTNGVYDPRAPFYMDPLHFPPGPHNRFLP